MRVRSALVGCDFDAFTIVVAQPAPSPTTARGPSLSRRRFLAYSAAGGVGLSTGATITWEIGAARSAPASVTRRE